MDDYLNSASPPKGFYLAVIAGMCVAAQGGVLLPFWMGVSIDAFGLSETQGGWLASVHLSAAALATITVAPFIHRINKYRGFSVGLLFSALGNGLSILAIWLDSLPMLFACRILCGVGEGVLIAIVSAAAGTTPKPIKTFAMMNVAVAVLAALIFFTSPYLVTSFGAAALFGMMLATALAVFPVAGKISSRAAPSLTGSTASRVSTTQHTESNASAFSYRSLVALLMFGLFACVIGGTFAFSQRIGINSVGLELDNIGLIIGIAAILMISGPLLANFLGNRFGQSRPVLSTVVAYTGVAFCFAFADSLWLYVIAMLGHAVVAGFTTTFLSAFMASLDSSGRVVAAAPAFAGLGGAAGPSLVASALPLLPGYQAIGWVAAAILLVVAVGFLVLTREIDRRNERLPEAACP